MVQRKLSESQMQELNALRDKCVLVLQFLNRRGELGDLARQFSEVIQQSFEANDLRGLRILWKDLSDWSKDLSSDQQLELETLLRVQLHVDSDDERTADVAMVREIQERGRIRNEREYRLVQARVEELRTSQNSVTDVAHLQALLAEY
jgi:hypothetical protein